MNRWIDKDPQESAGYSLDWSDALAGGDALASVTWSAAPSGLTLTSQSNSPSIASIVVGAGAAGTNYVVTCHITTSLGDQLEQSVLLKVRDK